MEARNILGRSEYTIGEIKGRTLVKSDSINLMQVYSPVDYETGILVVMVGHTAHMPVRNETAKLVKRAEDGLLYKKGSSVMIRLPKA